MPTLTKGGAGVPPPAACAACRNPRVRRFHRLDPFDVYACDACGLRFRHPLPDPDELEAMYEDPRYHASAYFQPAAAGAGRRSPELRIYERGLEDLAAMVGRRGALLDAGCGPGVFLDRARAAGWTVAGVELSARHVTAARARAALDVRQGDFLAAPFAPASFQAVTMWDFLEHVLDPRAVLAHARRLLAPGGVLLVFTIDSASLFNAVAALLYRATGGRATRPLELLYDARHNYYFTRRALARLLAAEGFAIERWRGDRAHLGRWLSEPAPWYLVAGGGVLDVLSYAAGRPYRRTALCRRA